MKITIEAETEEITDVLLALKGQHECRSVNMKLYPERTDYLDCLKAVLKTGCSTHEENLKKGT